MIREAICGTVALRSFSSKTGPAPPSWTAGKVEQQSADDGEALEEVHILPGAEDQPRHGLAVGDPERASGKGNQYQSSPARP